MMRKIKNVHAHEDPEQYQCFGCSPFNTNGLHLEFWEDGEQIVSYWQPEERLMGWVGVVHGGIQATLMDEIGGWVVYIKCETAGVTTDLNVKYRKPVLIENGRITITGRLKEKNSRFAMIETQLFSNDELCAEGELKYYIFPEKIAKEKYHYPGVEAFFS